MFKKLHLFDLDAFDVYVQNYQQIIDAPFDSLNEMTYTTCAIQCSDSLKKSQG